MTLPKPRNFSLSLLLVRLILICIVGLLLLVGNFLAIALIITYVKANLALEMMVVVANLALLFVLVSFRGKYRRQQGRTR